MAGVDSVRRHKGAIWRLTVERDGSTVDDEMDLADKFLKATLTDDAALAALVSGRIFVRVFIPPTTPTPYVAALWQTSFTLDGVTPGGAVQYGAGNRAAGLQYVVKVVDAGVPGQDYSDNVRPACARINDLLDIAGQTAVTGGTIINSSWAGLWAGEEAP